MQRVTSTDFQQAVGNYSDTAMSEPVVITSHGRDRLALINIKEYERFKAMEAEMEKQTFEERARERVKAHKATLKLLADR